MALFFDPLQPGTRGIAMNEGKTTRPAPLARHCSEPRRKLAAALAKAGDDDSDDQRPDPPVETDDPTPEEAGYGYGV
jgi:hypothetical protein